MRSVIAAAPSIHHEAIDWATRAAANGGVISTTTIRAVSEFCRAIDAAGIRSAMYRVNPFCGGNLSGCLVPLYRGPTFGGTNYGNATDTNANFVSGDFTEKTGLKGNGTTKYLATGFLPSSLPSVTSIHQSVSATGSATSGNAVFMGSYNGIAAGIFSLDEYAVAAGARAYRCGNITVGQYPTVTPTVAEPHMIGTRTSTTSAVIYRAGVSSSSNATSVTPTSTATQFIVFGLTGGLCAATLRMYSIGTGLNATQAAAFSAAVIAFNNALGR
jgi:hypothetical protein